MCLFTELALLYSGFMTIKYFRKKQESKINYNNYHNCLKSLAEYDPKLKEYLEERWKYGRYSKIYSKSR